ncbi:hypothetical protein [Teichococcus oryzae]|jgi:hypothetical protein|uniref:Uncharacterized protein n=1 Tax=Teichococcus oryzae TaxID=1608942 RepID=A0A5B2TIR2_9PROT|nr:hypothetical protein [Pseudoroseomonas oryzae]KAA2214003.1 hypothetical protein F0Q34_08150 [Pseudoroseomonas oryzae]
MMMSRSTPRLAHLVKIVALGGLFVLALGVAYKIKRVFRIDVFPEIDMVPDEELKALVMWFFHLVF